MAAVSSKIIRRKLNYSVRSFSNRRQTITKYLIESDFIKFSSKCQNNRSYIRYVELFQ